MSERYLQFRNMRTGETPGCIRGTGQYGERAAWDHRSITPTVPRDPDFIASPEDGIARPSPR